MAASSYSISKFKKDKLSLYNEDHLYKKRGLCPNRYELLREIFNRKKWRISFNSSKKNKNVDTEFFDLEFLYISQSQKIFFLPNHDDATFKDEKTIHGYYLTTRSDFKDSTEMQNEKIKLYIIDKNDISKYFPPLSEELIKQLETFHRISRNAERFIRGKWEDLIKDKEESGQYAIFYSEGFSRLNHQTTGRIYGNWDE